MSNINIDLNPVVGAILRVMVEPYQSFLATLQSDGRVTMEEIESLRAQILDRGDRLAELVQEELRESPS